MFITYNQSEDTQTKKICIKYTPKEISEFKKKIKAEFYSFLDSNAVKNDKSKKEDESFILPDEINKTYYLKYIQYILYTFNSTIVNMIIVYLNENKAFLVLFRPEENFIYNLICLLKNLMMNEIEVSYFTLLLDKFGYKYENIDNWIYLTVLGIITKKSTTIENDYSLFIKLFSRKYPKFEETYLNFTSDEKIIDKIEKKNINIKLINKRYKELTKPINSFCRKNYIILEGIIDKIVSLSHPYYKCEIPNNINKNENNIILNDDIISYINNFQKEINFQNIRNISNDNLDDLLNENIIFENLISSSLKLDDLYEK